MSGRVDDPGTKSAQVSGFNTPETPQPPDSVWQVLTSEPDTGVAMITLDGVVLYANEQIARIEHGRDIPCEALIGRSLGELFEPRYVHERLAIFQRVAYTGRPVLLRGIWRGWQVHSWIHHITTMPEDFAAASEGGAEREADRVLVISRRVASDEQREELAEAPYEYVESEVVELGPLDVLTPRELEVLALLGSGLKPGEAARAISRSEKTIEHYRTSIGRKLNVDDRVQLSEIARRAGLTLADADRQRVHRKGPPTAG